MIIDIKTSVEIAAKIPKETVRPFPPLNFMKNDQLWPIIKKIIINKSKSVKFFII